MVLMRIVDKKGFVGASHMSTVSERIARQRCFADVATCYMRPELPIRALPWNAHIGVIEGQFTEEAGHDDT